MDKAILEPGVEIAVEISDTQRHLRIDRELLARLVRKVLASEGVTRGSISIALVDNTTIQAINRRHLGHDYPTDVISFVLSDGRDPDLDGEIVVSAEMAEATARRGGVDSAAELALYVVHGLLHLCGYDDQSVGDRNEIRRREGEMLASEGLTNTFPLVGQSEATESERESTRCTV